MSGSNAEGAAELAINGGPKAFEGMTGKPQPKIGVAEFMSLARRFGFSPEALARMEGAVSDDDLAGGGPNLARYATAAPAPPAGDEMEAMAREMFGVRHALTVSSGTGALHAAMIAVGAKPGREVIVPAVGFLATSAAVAMTGATPVFCDIDESFQMDPAKLSPLINERTVAVVPTHQWGGVADMTPILDVARERGIRVIEDCAQSPGGRYGGRWVGTLGDIGCFSISAYKIIGGGEGGMLLTDDDLLFDRARQLAESGGLWRPDRFAPPQSDGELFVGTNYRMSDLEAAVDVVQLGKLGDVVGRHRKVFARVTGQLRTYREITPRRVTDRDGWIGYELRFYPETFDLARRIADALVAEGIRCGHRGPDAAPDWHVYRYMYPVILDSETGQACWKSGDCPVADDLYDRSVAVGMNQWWSDDDGDRVAAGINKVLLAYCTPDAAAAAWS